MSKSITYNVHFKPIVFPPLENTAQLSTSQTMPPPIASPTQPNPADVAIPTSTPQGKPLPEAVSQPSSVAHMLSQLHQNFMQRQAALYQQHQQLQQQLSKKVKHLFSGNSPTLTQAELSIETKANTTLPGPKFSREDLEILSSGKISSLFGDWFKPLDQYRRLIRMPEPPLLLADRVTGIDAEPGSMTTGTIWTETDVTEDAWYLHNGRMPMGITIESGQADLLLASWLGFDFDNRGERIYRLLGCEMTVHGERPKPGDTLCYDIHIDGQAKQGDIRLFFFHYDCRINGEVRLQVRQGQAGFFTDTELAESAGVLWDPAEEQYDPSLRLDPPAVKTHYQTFSRDQLIAFSKGQVVDCFGPGFERALTHTRTPNISGGNMLFLHEITDFDTEGGPAGRGYMRAVQQVHPDDWFFKGHFKNDPCMPGTLMLEGGLQLAASYLTALGYTLTRDGWRFEPVTEEKFKLRCRGQVIPTTQQVVYEIFVSSIVADPIPTLYADLLGTADGLKSFHTRIGLRLVPDWPLSENDPLLLNHVETKPVTVINGFPFDFHSLLACAWGKPSEAFGELYQPFDGYRKCARLPGPPYHFMTRITNINANIGEFKSGGDVEFEYDVPQGAWYFSENGYPTLPFCVFLEATLQPCGWLASFVGSALRAEKDLLFRNLDGTATWTREVLPTSGTLKTNVKIKNISESAGMIIESFDVSSYIGETCIYRMETVFGFFPVEAFENQVGLPVPAYENNILSRPSDFFVDLTQHPYQYFSATARLAGSMLLMIDRVTGYWPEQQGEFCAQLRAEKTVDPDEWFFKAHFMNDPVQPGSLGLEAMLQLLQFYMLHEKLHEGMGELYFEPLMLDEPLTWKYRGQVTPKNNTVQIIAHISEKGKDERGAYVKAQASLWVDGKRIYEAKNMGMRVSQKV